MVRSGSATCRAAGGGRSPRRRSARSTGRFTSPQRLPDGLPVSPTSPRKPMAQPAHVSEPPAAGPHPLARVVDEVGRRLLGQNAMVERLLIGLLTGGHILLEGVPGLAKTLAVRTLSEIIHASFSRIQFTPDLLPADLIGTMVFDQKTQDFFVRKGPLFANIILADEVNRAPAKVQSALLEAMQEKQVTIGGTTYPLGEPFLVLATQNTIES